MTENDTQVETVAQRIKQERKERGLSQGDLAEKMGVSQPAVVKWESGKAEPGPDNLDAIKGWLEEDPEGVPIDPCDVCDTGYVPMAMRTVAVRKDDEVHQATLCHWCASSTTVREVTNLDG